MKKILMVVLMLWTAGANVSAANAQAETMKYRMALSNADEWMSDKQQEREFLYRQIDMIMRDGFNMIMIGPLNFAPVYLVDYAKTPYPEAAQLSSAQVASNLKNMRENMQYAKKRGIKYIITRSYNMYVPYNFWKAHQKELNPDGIFDRYIEQSHQGDLYTKAKTGKEKNALLPHAQWNNKTYRDFFVYSYEKLFDLLPDLDGMNTAFAEVAWIVDMDKLRAGNWKQAKDCIDRKATQENFIDFASELFRIIDSKRGKEGIIDLREWYMTPEVLAGMKIPKDRYIISSRYGGFDQPLVNYPTWAGDLVKQGYTVVLDIHTYEAEFPKPIYFYNNAFYNQMFDRIVKAGFAGVCHLDYSLNGSRNEDLDNPMRQLALQNFSAGMQGRAFTDKEVTNLLTSSYGKATGEVINSLRYVNDGLAYYVKLLPAWFWMGDGLSPGGIGKQSYWMFFDDPDAIGKLGFVRQEVVGLPEYIAVALKGNNELEKAKAEWKKAGRISPTEVPGLMHEYADKGIASILAARKLSPKAAYMQELVASAFVYKELAARADALLRSAVAFYMSGYIWNGKFENSKERNNTGINMTKECAAAWMDFIKHDNIIFALTGKYLPRRYGSEKDLSYGFAKQLFGIINVKFEEPDIDRAELDRISKIIENK